MNWQLVSYVKHQLDNESVLFDWGNSNLGD